MLMKVLIDNLFKCHLNQTLIEYVTVIGRVDVDLIFVFVKEGMIEVNRIGERSIYKNSRFLACQSLVEIISEKYVFPFAIL